MANRSVLILCLLVFGNALYQVESVLKTTFIEDLCYDTQNSVYDLRYDTSGVLMSAPKLYPTEGFQCEVVFSPPKGASVVLSIYRYDLYTDDVLIIEDADRHRIALMGRGVFKEERKSVVSEGKLRVFYKTPNKTSVHTNAGFQFTFTKVMKSPCSSNEFKCKNDHCVLKEYVCDGHNHCGDNSDQKKCDSIRRENKVEEPYPSPSHEHSSSVAIWISLLAIAFLIVGSVIVITIVVLVRRAKKKKAQSNNNNSNTIQVGGNSIPLPVLPQQTPSTRPLQSVSATVHQQNSSASVHGVQDSSMYNRARQSLQVARTQPPGIIHVPRQQNAAPARHQVPSVYPSLDRIPSAPETQPPPAENVPRQQNAAPARHQEPSMYPNLDQIPLAPETQPPRVENVPREQNAAPVGHHQVPTMYPDLDQIPSAPEMHGVDNPEFKADEIDLENLSRNLTRLLSAENTKR